MILLTLSACAGKQNAAGEPAPINRSTTTTSTSTPPSAAPVPPGDPVPCTAALLSGSVQPMNSSAGNRYVTLTVENTSQQVCTLQGFGRLQLLTAGGEPLPTNAERNLDPVPTLVTLRPDATAGKILHWSVLAAEGDSLTGPCQPKATAIRVTPPDEEESFDVDYEFGSVCNDGQIDTSAYFPN
ncbi:DUF4232 domain-containing protein [Actinophytocola sp.]|uniref:DUF4232 domain-containing protein n=1 Tax=Actinophytocola sp. TaxID=1872138 RepID=UPI002ED3BD3D